MRAAKRFCILLLCMLMIIPSCTIFAKTLKPKAYKSNGWGNREIVKKRSIEIKKGTTKIKIPTWKGKVTVVIPGDDVKTIRAKQSSIVFLKFKAPATKEYSMQVSKVKYNKATDFNNVEYTDGWDVKNIGTVTVMPVMPTGIGSQNAIKYAVGVPAAASKKVTVKGNTLYDTKGAGRFHLEKGQYAYFVVSSYAAKECKITIK